MNKLFKVSPLIISAAVLGNIKITFASSLECKEYIGCEKKLCEIEKQITIAESKDNNAKVDGLNIALKASKSNCSTKSLVEDLISEISEVKEEILEYENDLKKAKDDEKPKKTRKYNDKIAEEKIKVKLKTLQ
ncbi:DUF1090 domain-containing protein [Psychromonas hadalis]|uniref:DUF1090 domain-containing protein n=1 Tax=Psychromonas hadalis TaxID=211669 RepID=UPI0003B784AD|nr:DUF1090 domain-containing protein [Psychromonas hadalis]